MRISRWIGGTFGVLALVAAAGAERTRPEASPRGEVVWQLHALHCAEIGMAKLEVELTQWNDARAYAQGLVRDHRTANKDLLSYAADADLRIEPTAAFREDDLKTQSMLGNLRGARVGELDREFLAMMVRGHSEAIGFVRQARDGTGDRTLQEILDELLPTLERHRDGALELQVKLRARPPVRSSRDERRQ